MFCVKLKRSQNKKNVLGQEHRVLQDCLNGPVPKLNSVVENDGAEEHIMDDVPNANFLQSLPSDISPPSNLQPDRASRYGERHIPISYSCTAAYTPNLDLSGSLHQPVHITSRVTTWEAGPNESAVAYSLSVLLRLFVPLLPPMPARRALLQTRPLHPRRGHNPTLV
ncbi:hypothetical protein C8F01DRAFT_1085741 [Mycena amicta]|nr:hypothetical protein C8F01DRAFT_1085741 [Mycena amicta]